MRLDLEWGKAVRRCAVPYTPATAATSSQCFRPSLPSMTNEALAGPTHAAAAAVPLLPVMGTAPEGTSNAPLIVISPPTVNCSLLFGGGGDGLRPDVLQRVIDMTAKFVAVDGAALEKVTYCSPTPPEPPHPPHEAILAFPSSNSWLPPPTPSSGDSTA